MYVRNFALFFVFIFFADVTQGANLYSVITQYSASKGESLVWVVNLNPKTGEVTNNTEAIVYSGLSVSQDGISTFDQQNGIYHFSTDYKDAYIYNVNVRTQQLLPYTALYADSIEALTWDSSSGSLYALSYQAESGASVQEVSSDQIQTVWTVDTKYNVKYLMNSALDSKNKIYYYFGKIGFNQIVLDYGISVINLTNSEVINEVMIDNKTCNVFPEEVVYHEKTGMIIGGGGGFTQYTLEYYYFKIDPKTGACQKKLLNVPDGVVTCWAYDEENEVLIFHEVTDRGGFLNFFNIATETQLPAVKVLSTQLPESLEWSID